MTIDQTESVEIGLARARLRWHQERRAAAVKWQAIPDQPLRDKHMADATVRDAEQQIGRIIAWLAAQGAV